jgi:hypothetical protein
MRRNEWESWIVEQLGVERCDVGKSLFHTPQWRSRKIAKWHQAWHPMLFCLSAAWAVLMQVRVPLWAGDCSSRAV